MKYCIELSPSQERKIRAYLKSQDGIEKPVRANIHKKIDHLIRVGMDTEGMYPELTGK